MKILKSLSSYIVLSLAVSVTVGSMYVTVSAAARQDEVQELVPEPAPLGFEAEEIAPAAEAGASEMLDAPVITVDSVDEETLTPEEIRSNRQHAINLDANGGFSGTLSALTGSAGGLQPAANMTVRLIKDGSVIASTESAADGGFAFSGLQAGVVALLAYSDTALLLYGVRLVEGENVFADATPVKLEANEGIKLEVSSAVVSGADLQVARELIFGNLPTQDMRFTGSVSEKDSTYGYGEGEAATSQVNHVVQLNNDGTLQGTINLLDPRTGRNRQIKDLTLHFIRNGELAASTMVQPSGDFEIVGLIPGAHSVVATGNDGTLAFGIDIVGSAFEQADAGEKYKFAKVLQVAEFAASPANSVNFNSGNAAAVSDGELDPNSGSGGLGPGVAGGPMGPAGGPMGAPGGGFGGGTGAGGGGVGGGGGGLGTLLGAAAAGALGYALGDSSPNR